MALARPQTAYALGTEGHEIVGIIALKHLDPRVQATVDQMLSADSDHLAAPDIADAANWADKFRDSDRNTTQIRYRLTPEWHFVDLELDNPDVSAACFGHPPAAVPASKGPANSCVVDRISAFQSELKSLPSTDPERVVVALKFILHFVGDVHQPLHAADHDDQGGNKVMVLYGDRTIGTPPGH